MDSVVLVSKDRKLSLVFVNLWGGGLIKKRGVLDNGKIELRIKEIMETKISTFVQSDSHFNLFLGTIFFLILTLLGNNLTTVIVTRFKMKYCFAMMYLLS